MKSKFINVLMFAAGAAIGSLVTWKIVKDRYERAIEEEIESVKDAFAEMYGDQSTQDDATQSDDEDAQYDTRQIQWEDLEDLDPSELEDTEEAENEYQRLVNQYNNEKGGGEDMEDGIRVISPYEFDTVDYRIVELTYYADGVLEDEDGDIVENVEELIGPDALNTFGNYEDDAVHVRNDHLKMDIEICRDYKTYEEARSINGPQRVYDE